MIIVMKPHAAESSIKAITDYIQESGLYAICQGVQKSPSSAWSATKTVFPRKI